MPLQRQLRVLLVMVLLVGSVVHQLSLHYDMDELRRQLQASLLAGGSSA